MTFVLLACAMLIGTVAACVLAIVIKRELQQEIARLFNDFAEAVK